MLNYTVATPKLKVATAMLF